MYLMIENPGLAPVEGFTMLGVSTARGNANAIGQFGTGATNGVNILLRNKIAHNIFIGEDELKFTTKPAMMGDKAYQRVHSSFKGEEQPLGFSLDYGALDWAGVDMALREFVSNAIDAGGETGAKVSIVNDIVPAKGYTRIFVEAVDSVTAFYNTLKERFLHFAGNNKLGVIRKDRSGFANVYRKGVLIRTIKPGQYEQQLTALFDYNFGDELKIDESRNMENHALVHAAGKALLDDVDALAEVFKGFVERKYSWEHTVAPGAWLPSQQRKVREAWQAAVGDKMFSSSAEVVKLMAERGKPVVLVTNAWVPTLQNSGIEQAETKLSRAEKKGGKILPANAVARRNLSKVWKWIVRVGLDNNKPMPKLQLFTKLNQNGTTLMGYVENEIVYINQDFIENIQTYLEECLHYTSGNSDFTREFQDVILQFGTRMLLNRR